MLTLFTQQYLDDALSVFDADRAAYLRHISNSAILLHKDQAPRPSGESYDNHIVRVASRIINDFGVADEELFVIGLLHDAVEDQLENLTETKQASREDAYILLEKNYSQRVSNAIRGLSNSEQYETTEDRTERNKLYVDHVIHECNANTDCFVVKLSDFFDNAMQLQLNTKIEHRIKGAAKYLPLFDYFSQTLQSSRTLPMSTATRNELANRIETQKEYAASLIATQLEFPYQIVTFLDREPQPGESVYYGSNGWFAQLALKRRFKLNDTGEDELVQSLRTFFSQITPSSIITGDLVKPDQMPVRVIDIKNQSELKTLHKQLINHLGTNIISRYPERDGENYYAHITAEYGDTFVIPVDAYSNNNFPLDNIWLLKDIGDENSKAYIKLV